MFYRLLTFSYWRLLESSISRFVEISYLTFIAIQLPDFNIMWDLGVGNLGTDYIYSEVMKAIQCAHPPHHHNSFVATCRLWTVSGGVHALLALEPTECSTSTRQGT